MRTSLRAIPIALAATTLLLSACSGAEEQAPGQSQAVEAEQTPDIEVRDQGVLATLGTAGGFSYSATESGYTVLASEVVEGQGEVLAFDPKGQRLTWDSTTFPLDPVSVSLFSHQEMMFADGKTVGAGMQNAQDQMVRFDPKTGKARWALALEDSSSYHVVGGAIVFYDSDYKVSAVVDAETGKQVDFTPADPSYQIDFVRPIGVNSDCLGMTQGPDSSRICIDPITAQPVQDCQAEVPQADKRTYLAKDGHYRRIASYDNGEYSLLDLGTPGAVLAKPSVTWNKTGAPDSWGSGFAHTWAYNKANNALTVARDSDGAQTDFDLNTEEFANCTSFNLLSPAMILLSDCQPAYGDTFAVLAHVN